MKYVYSFNEGNKDMRQLLGGKGANLAQMCNLGLPVPLGFTITTEACNSYYEENKNIKEEILNEVEEKLEELQNKTNKYLGSFDNPLLLSVRSGAQISMPGMMDSILNLGINDEVVKVLEKLTDNKFFAYDSYRRFIMMYSDVVMGYPREEFERVLDKFKSNAKVSSDTMLSGNDMENIVLEYKAIYKKYANEDFPQEPKIQLINSIKAVFESWNNDRAISYRKMNNIDNSLGTAVNVQSMVYGNMGSTSGTGVAFSRNPITGENKLYGEYLINAQGEDVVSGVRTPSDINTLKDLMPSIYEEFYNIAKKLEEHYKDMQDMEFTIENNKLYILQTRIGKRTAQSSVKIALDLYKEGLITKEEAIMRVDANSLDQLLHKTFSEESIKKAKIIGKGLAASPGAAIGKIYFNAHDVSVAAKNKEDCILVRLETSPEDIEGMKSANGILTFRGGKTSHAAVVARGMGKCCVSGCSDLQIDEENKTIKLEDGTILKEKDYISIDGTSGCVYLGSLELQNVSISGDFKEFMNLVDETRELGVRVNADTKEDSLVAINFGADGIGLCRSEHMFFSEERILAVRQMILAEAEEDRNKALDKLVIYQQKDYEDIFKVMNNKEVTIRLLDPPLHEFLPKTEEDMKKLAKSLDIDINEVEERTNQLKEFNPMMGHRGCRLSITYPEIATMQASAIANAIVNATQDNIKVIPEVMIPLVSDIEEFRYVKQLIKDKMDSILKEANIDIDYKIGTMIEVPRAAVLAYSIAKEADFFSFGTNDLTQLTYGFSRDDSQKFINDYLDKSILKQNPFETIDVNGVGKLIDYAIKEAKRAKPNIKLGICGEHGGEVNSINFCQSAGLDYVSCSAYRIPIARLASAQAAIKANQK